MFFHPAPAEQRCFTDLLIIERVYFDSSAEVTMTVKFKSYGTATPWTKAVVQCTERSLIDIFNSSFCFNGGGMLFGLRKHLEQTRGSASAYDMGVHDLGGIHIDDTLFCLERTSRRAAAIYLQQLEADEARHEVPFGKEREPAHTAANIYVISDFIRGVAWDFDRLVFVDVPKPKKDKRRYERIRYRFYQQMMQQNFAEPCVLNYTGLTNEQVARLSATLPEQEIVEHPGLLSIISKSLRLPSLQ